MNPSCDVKRIINIFIKFNASKTNSITLCFSTLEKLKSYKFNRIVIMVLYSTIKLGIIVTFTKSSAVVPLQQNKQKERRRRAELSHNLRTLGNAYRCLLRPGISQHSLTTQKTQ